MLSIKYLNKIRDTILRLTCIFHIDDWLLHCDNRILESIKGVPLEGLDMLDTYTIMVNIISHNLKHHNHHFHNIYPYHLNNSQSLAFWYQFVAQFVKPFLQPQHVYLSNYPIDIQQQVMPVDLADTEDRIRRNFRRIMLVRA